MKANLHPECLLNMLREVRKPKLAEADYLVETALDLGVDVTPFRQYRQALRDITKHYQSPEGVQWPQKPSLPQASA
ncbi:phage tail assembly chaperone [Vibrio tubiashii]|uniref:Phage tail assembly chaperone-like domain-containing protein n=1 Tax=Vibrio tubiashii ATCC 19109 TaxID=1051646 RepID=F9SZZ1_9VIBR|nr:phage tail assembly chaperone [Vibrio tubiashii]AIW16280.1 hypothetical protein IX91_19490 [Vibrio tubiashii ATCC 19109]EGU59069.1 hypothetical protein VITU9109_18985 [Vibrio tubiashii ATCC 19109]EIF05929.1 hypothetical protein VT1337_00775 [Vibrio tubiashii NCIMB 1337 = ATCC 19106]